MIFFITIISMMFSCSNNIKQDSLDNTSNSFSEDIEELSNLIRLDIKPNSAKWKLTKLGVENSSIPGPEDYTLVAILKYDMNDFKIIKSEIEKNKIINNGIYLDSTSIKVWYPKAIEECFLKENNYYRINPKAYNATVFTKIPLRSGFCFMHEETYTILISLGP